MSSKEIKLSIAAANGGAGPPSFPGSSSITSLVTAEPWRDGPPTTSYEQTGSSAIDIPRPNRQSRPPLFVPTQSSSPNWSIVPLPPSPNFEWLPRIDTHPSVASPGLFTNPQTSNSPSAEGPYGAALIQRPNPTQPRQIAPPQSPSSSARSHNTIYTPRRSPMDRLYGTCSKQRWYPPYLTSPVQHSAGLNNNAA